MFCWTLSASWWFPLAIMVGQEILIWLFFPLNMVSSTLLRPQHGQLDKSTTMLSGRSRFFITRQQSCSALAARAGWPANNFLSGKLHFLASGSLCLVHPCAQKDVSEALDIPHHPPHIHTGWGKWWVKESFLSELKRPYKHTWLMGMVKSNINYSSVSF